MPKSPAPVIETKPKDQEYFFAVGRRKRAIARVRLYPKHGKEDNIDITVNGKPVGQYFSNPSTRLKYAQPLELTDSLNRFKITAKIEGSGVYSQLDALLHAMARALIKADAEFRPILKRHGFLLRDPRKKQRRMIGRGGKSRAKKQSPKR